MNTISINYTLIWQFKESPIYQMTRCKKVININRGKIVKCVLNGGSVGGWIAGKFIPKSKINDKVDLIPKTKCPF